MEKIINVIKGRTHGYSRGDGSPQSAKRSFSEKVKTKNGQKVPAFRIEGRKMHPEMSNFQNPNPRADLIGFLCLTLAPLQVTKVHFSVKRPSPFTALLKALLKSLLADIQRTVAKNCY